MFSQILCLPTRVSIPTSHSAHQNSLSKHNHFPDLPEDLLILISRELSMPDTASLYMTCRKFSRLAQSERMPSVWLAYSIYKQIEQRLQWRISDSYPFLIHGRMKNVENTRGQRNIYKNIYIFEEIGSKEVYDFQIKATLIANKGEGLLNYVLFGLNHAIELLGGEGIKQHLVPHLKLTESNKISMRCQLSLICGLNELNRYFHTAAYHYSSMIVLDQNSQFNQLLGL